MKKICLAISLICNVLIVKSQFFYKTNTVNINEELKMAVEISKNTFLCVGTHENSDGVYRINKNGVMDSVMVSPEVELKNLTKVNDNLYLVNGVSFDSNNVKNIYCAYIDSNLNILKSQKIFADSLANNFNIKTLIVDNYIYIHLYLFFLGPTSELKNKVLKIDTTFNTVAYIYPLNGNAYLFDFTYYKNRFRFLYAGSLFYQYHVYDGILSYDKNFNLVKMDSVLCTWVGDIEMMKGNYVYTGIGTTNVSFITLKDTLNNLLCQKTMYQDLSKESYLCFNNSLISYGDFAYATTIYDFDYNTTYSSNLNYVLVNKYDYNLNEKWQKYIGGDKYYLIYSISPTSDSGCVISGVSYDATYGNQNYDAFLLVIDSLGNTISGVPDNAYVFNNALVYPNPGISDLNILMPENFKATTFELYNSVGVLCKEEQFDSDRLNLNTNELKCGLYFYRLRQGNNIVSQGKWVKE